MDWKHKLFKKNTLWAVYRASPRFWSNAFNMIVFTAIFLALVIFSALHLKPPAWAPFLKSYDLNTAINMWAAQGFSYAMTMVAFLLAGFTIFSTITKPSLFAELAQIPHAGSTGLSELEFVFFVFINVFVHYMAFLGVSAVIVFFNGTAGPLVLAGELFKALLGTGPFDLAQHVVFVLFAAWFFALILKLKSFVWNVYQMVLIVIVAEKEPVDTCRFPLHNSQKPENQP